MSSPKLEKVVNTVFGRTFELSLTKGYVAKWGPGNAARELIQNALDSDSPFSYEFLNDYGSTTLILRSEFSTLTPQTLLLGATSKSDSDSSIGSFGEGYKIALLVLCRAGYDVEVLNGDFIWRPRFKFSRTFGEEVLVVDETVAPDKTNKGLTFVLKGIEDNLLEEIVESCLLMQDNVGQIKKTQYGDILLDRPGKLYVGNLFICQTELRHGYNILPKHIRLERDRQTVSSWELKDITLKMWFDTQEFARVAEMIADEVPDVAYAEYNSPVMLKEACYQVFKERHPGSLIASSSQEMKKMIEDGMTKTVYCGSSMHSIVTKSPSYQESAKSIRIVFDQPAKVLKDWLTANRSEMRTKAIVEFKNLIELASNWQRK